MVFLYQGAKTGKAYIRKMQVTTKASKQANIFKKRWKVDRCRRKLTKQPILMKTPMQNKKTIMIAKHISSSIWFFSAAKDSSSNDLGVVEAAVVNSKWKFSRNTSLLFGLVLGDTVKSVFAARRVLSKYPRIFLDLLRKLFFVKLLPLLLVTWKALDVQKKLFKKSIRCSVAFCFFASFSLWMRARLTARTASLANKNGFWRWSRQNFADFGLFL